MIEFFLYVNKGNFPQNISIFYHDSFYTLSRRILTNQCNYVEKIG